MAETHVALRGVTRVFPATATQSEVKALGPIDLDLERGEFFVVVGPSGCGKSTLLEIIAGLNRPTAGAATLEGRPIAGEVPEGIGVVFQEDASFPWLSVTDNIAFGLRQTSLDKDEIAARVDHALRLMDLAEFAAAYPVQLSGGMRQRVCLARTLVQRPRVILLDEPFGALDQQTRFLMGDELLRLWRESGATILLITHSLDEAAMLADRIGVMSARPGRMLEIIATGWGEGRGSRMVATPRFGEITARLWQLLREESLRAMSPDMTPGRVRFALAVALVLLLEALCRFGVINRFSMIPPSEILWHLGRLLASAQMWPAILKTLTNVVVACVAAIVAGVILGTLIHAWRALRETLDPLFAAYYAIPVYAFYPLFIVIFGLGDLPQVLIGFMLGLVAVVVNTLNGLDRVPRVLIKTARIHRLGPVATALKVTLPYAVPYIFTGIKLAVAYSFIGVIGAELIMSRTGLGYEIGFAYNNFDNAVMYPLIVFVLAVAATVNTMFFLWEKKMLARRRK